MTETVSLSTLHHSIRALGRPMTYYPSLVPLIGKSETLFLSQLLYWSPRGKKADGWIYKPVDEVEDETGLTYREQHRARKELVKRGIIEERYDRKEHVMYYRVLPAGVNALLPLLEQSAAEREYARKADARESVDQKVKEHPPEEHMTKGHMPQEHMTKCKVAPNKMSGGTLQNVRSYKEQRRPKEDTCLKVKESYLGSWPERTNQPPVENRNGNGDHMVQAGVLALQRLQKAARLPPDKGRKPAPLPRAELQKLAEGLAELLLVRQAKTPVLVVARCLVEAARAQVPDAAWESILMAAIKAARSPNSHKIRKPEAFLMEAVEGEFRSLALYPDGSRPPVGDAFRRGP